MQRSKTYVCLQKAVEALEKNDVTMLKFWNDQYEFQNRSVAVREKLKECTLDVIRDRLSHRNPLTTAAYEIRANYIEEKRTIYVASEE